MSSTPRLYFLDALRAFAILMMLQGHFVSGLLHPSEVDATNQWYTLWQYCRGFTAPVFFTITGWVFTFLLLRSEAQGGQNIRIKKGIKRFIELLFWGYLLRLNLRSLISGTINRSFFYPDVLQIIGLGIGFILLVYFLGQPLKKWGTALLFLCMGCGIFLLQPLYVDLTFTALPKALAAYLTKANGGVFYLFPWVGYVSLGAFIAYIFPVHTEQLWAWGAGFALVGYACIEYSSSFFIALEGRSGLELFRQVAYNNFLFIRLGDVCVLIAIFMWMNSLLKGSFWARIGGQTLNIYIVHYFLLYGSLTGVGLYKAYHQQLSLTATFFGGCLFIVVCVTLALIIPKMKLKLKNITPFT